MEERLSNSMAATPRLGSRLAWHDAGRHGSGAGSSGQSQMNLGPGCLQQTRARRKLPLPTMVEENGVSAAEQTQHLLRTQAFYSEVKLRVPVEKLAQAARFQSVDLQGSEGIAEECEVWSHSTSTFWSSLAVEGCLCSSFMTSICTAVSALSLFTLGDPLGDPTFLSEGFI
ncbi:hypothetical protein AGIG_G19535 [Arapaima gigas]